jgi:hypothetical protein
MKENKKETRPASRAPLKVLSTSLGLAIAAHMLLTPGMFGEYAHAEGTEPKLVEWSTEEVKAYFNPSLDWSLPDIGSAQLSPSASPSPGTSGAGAAGSGAAGSGGTNGNSTVIINQGGGFGWDDLLMYHLLFNRGGSYSSGTWHNSHPVYDPRTNQAYQPKTYSAGAFENKPVPGTNVKPKTSASSGSFTTKQGASNSSKSSSSSSTKSSSGSSGTSSGTTSGTTSGSNSGTSSGSSSKSSSSSSSSSSGKSTSSSSGSIGGKSGGFSSSGGSSSGS